MADLKTVTSALAEAEVSWALSKGPVLREVMFARRGVRDYTDLDVLVAPRDIRRAVHVLHEHGASLHESDLAAALRDRTAEIALVLPRGTVLDLHWSLVNVGRVRDGFHLPAADFLQRRTWRDLSGSAVPTLADEDLVLHVMLHACLSGGSSLRWLLDAQQSLQWFASVSSASLLRARARETGTLPAMRGVLTSSSRYVDPDLSDWRRRVGWPTLWNGLLDAVSRARPPSSPSRGDRSVTRFFQSTRPTIGASTRALVATLRGRDAPRPEVVRRPVGLADPLLARWLDAAESGNSDS